MKTVEQLLWRGMGELLDATMHDFKGFSAGMRLRYFGPRNLTSDGIFRSQATALLNAGVDYQSNRNWRVVAEF